MKVFLDEQRHLVTIPYDRATLHAAAKILGLKRCWFRPRPYPHYDLPKRWCQDWGLKLDEQLLNLDCAGISYYWVSPREIVKICKGERTS